MEYINSEGKSLKDIEKELGADIKIVIVGHDGIGSKLATIYAQMLVSSDHAVVKLESLPKSNQDFIAQLEEDERINESNRKTFGERVFPIKAIEPMTEVFIEQTKRPWETSKRNKKLKGWQKGKR